MTPEPLAAPPPLRCPPALVADQVSRMQPLLPARIRAVRPILHGWVLTLKGDAGASVDLLLALQPGALGLWVLDADLHPLLAPLPEGFDPPPPSQHWFTALEGAHLIRAFAPAGEPIAVLGLDAPAGGGAPPRALILELFGAAGNCLDLAVAARPHQEEDWLDGRILNCFHPAHTAFRSIGPGEPYRLPRVALPAQLQTQAVYDPAEARRATVANLHAHWQAQAVDRLAKPLRASLDRQRKRLAAIQAQCGTEPEAARLVLEGQFLQAHPQRGTRGLTSVDPRPERDIWNLDQPIAVPPHLTLAEHAAKLFQRAQRMRKGIAFARATLPGLQAAIATVELDLARVLGLGAVPDWPSAAAQIAAYSVTAQRPNRFSAPAQRLAHATTDAPSAPRKAGPRTDSTRPAKEQTPAADVPRFVRRFLSSDGWIIDVGKSARDNHTLTFQSAHGNDLVLHIAGSPGAHVLVRCKEKPAKSADPEMPPATLLEAARLCLHYSSRKAASGEVVYALRKHCKAGSHTGQIQIAKPKYLRVKADAAALQRILDRKPQ